MNHKLLEMLNEAGFDFTPDIMAKLPAFENLVWLEREACAKVCEILWDTTQNGMATEEEEWYGDKCAAAIRARGQHAN